MREDLYKIYVARAGGRRMGQECATLSPEGTGVSAQVGVWEVLVQSRGGRAAVPEHIPISQSSASGQQRRETGRTRGRCPPPEPSPPRAGGGAIGLSDQLSTLPPPTYPDCDWEFVSGAPHQWPVTSGTGFSERSS
ncbi:hypothetical protein XELAEV_18041287mg [Xenopus laevis]|uniref:Uncharacterized protein n=1 Tax=Xenopus laevis TaxID=8355 RepID=A0A974H5A7_XENLA|nr:hypothetical protein XELAEV_18041287mg [Xenopus laevis]